MPYDPTIYRGAAPFYAEGRPPYSAALVETLRREVGLDSRGRLLDVGCGPGILTVTLAPHLETAIGLDPDAAMLAEAARRAEQHGVTNVEWIQAVAEDIPSLPLGSFTLVTFGQSFQWTDRERVAEAVYDILEPGGAIVLLAHTVDGRPAPPDPGQPPMPHDEVRDLVGRYLGPRLRAGQSFSSPQPDRYEDALARTRFGVPRHVFAPGRPDLVRDIDSVVANYYSMSWSAPHLFGDERPQFEAELRALLRRHSPEGLFWDWPGDTELVIATKPP